MVTTDTTVPTVDSLAAAMSAASALLSAAVANTKQDKPLLIRLAAETDGPRGARIPGGLESDCAL